MLTAYYDCHDADTIRPYVGIYGATGAREVFELDHIPTQDEGLPYVAVIGPFDTIEGARFCARFGRGNPHIQHVDDAERLARLYPEEVQS